eukprot:6189532-Pleurochrysis_carterae.AAC.1
MHSSSPQQSRQHPIHATLETSSTHDARNEMKSPQIPRPALYKRKQLKSQQRRSAHIGVLLRVKLAGVAVRISGAGSLCAQAQTAVRDTVRGMYFADGKK